MPDDAFIVSAAESPYSRHPGEGTTTEGLLADAFHRALLDAGVARTDVDGLAVSSFTLAPDHAIDLAWRLGLRLRWLMEDTNGGASGLNMLQHSVSAIRSGDARTVVVLAGDRFESGVFDRLVDRYNVVTRDHLAPLPFGGPNAQFALLTQRHMKARGLARSDYGRVSVSQRAWAAANPGAVYRERLTLEEYLAAPFVADPLVRYDCVPVVSGADAVVVTGAPAERAVEIKAFRAVYNHDNQLGGGLELGLAQEAPGLWDEAGFGPEDVDVVSVYDDYPAMVLIQLDELGLVPGHDSHAFVARLERCRLPVNTSGGQLSAGQAGASASVGGGRGDRLLDGPRLVACRC